MTTAVIVPVADKFSCVINGSIFGTSRHIDYWEHHAKLADLKTLNALNVTLFVHTDVAGAVTECIEAAAMSKGKSYKTAERCTGPLTPEFKQLVAEAFTLATKPAEVKPAEAAPAAAQAAAQAVETVQTVPTVPPAPSATVETVTQPANDPLVRLQANAQATPKKSRKAK